MFLGISLDAICIMSEWYIDRGQASEKKKTGGQLNYQACNFTSYMCWAASGRLMRPLSYILCIT